MPRTPRQRAAHLRLAAPPRRLRHAVVALVAVLALAGCEVRATTQIEVREDGSGVVRVIVDLDAEAAAKVPELEEVLLVDDLRKAGWEVTGPTERKGGSVRITAEKPFADPTDLQRVVTELTGPDGSLSSLRLERRTKFARTDLDLTGTLDLRRGLEGFTDTEVTQALGGLPFGRTPEEMAALAGGDPTEKVEVDLDVSLPGTSETIEGRWGQATPVDVSSTTRSWAAWIWAALAVASLVLAVVILLQISRHRRIRRPPRYLHEPSAHTPLRRPR